MVIVRINEERSISYKLDVKLGQCILHGNFLFVDWIVSLVHLKLTRLIVDMAFRTACVLFHQRTANYNINIATGHINWSIMVDHFAPTVFYSPKMC